MAHGGWIERAIIEKKKKRIKFKRMDRDIISSSVIEDAYGNKTKETIFYRNGARYFISVDGTPVATAFTKQECAKKAFLAGHISDSDYVTFTRGYKASQRYNKMMNKGGQ